MFHKSPEDGRDHLTLVCIDKNGKHLSTKHITKDPEEQNKKWLEMSRNDSLTPLFWTYLSSWIRQEFTLDNGIWYPHHI